MFIFAWKGKSRAFNSSCQVLNFKNEHVWHNYSRVENEKQSLLAALVYLNSYYLKTTHSYEKGCPEEWKRS